MAMPLCGTFHYVAAVPDGSDLRRAPIFARDESCPPGRLHPDPFLGSRLVGFAPSVEVRGHRLVITATSRDRADVSAASFALDPELIDTVRGRDVIRVVREKTGDVGVAVLREGSVVFAVGAIAALPLGADVAAGGGPGDATEYVDVRVGAHSARLSAGERLALGRYEVEVVRPALAGVPGHCESVALCRAGWDLLEAAVRSAQLLDAGLGMVRWDAVRPEASILMQVFVPERCERPVAWLPYSACGRFIPRRRRRRRCFICKAFRPGTRLSILTRRRADPPPPSACPAPARP
jgi:hypothetical protein